MIQSQVDAHCKHAGSKEAQHTTPAALEAQSEDLCDGDGEVDEGCHGTVQEVRRGPPPAPPRVVQQHGVHTEKVEDPRELLGAREEGGH